MMHKRTVKQSFTLLEIIVAMGVFTVLVAMMLQLFAGAQRIWSGSESKNANYADARVAMDLMSNMLQSVYYSAGETCNGQAPFQLKSDRLCLMSRYPLAFGNSTYPPLSLVMFKLGTYTPSADEIANGKNPMPQLLIRVMTSDENNLKGALNKSLTEGNFDTLSTTTDSSVKEYPVIDRVTALQFTPGFWQNGEIKWLSSTPSGFDAGIAKSLPYAVQIRLTVIDQQGYEKWMAKSGGTVDLTDSDLKKFRQPFEKTFTRVVYLGDRNYTP